MAWQTLDQQYAQQLGKTDRSNYLKDIIAGLSIANNNTPETLLGYALGRFASDYVNRGIERHQQNKNKKAFDEAMNNGAQQQTPGLLDGVQGGANTMQVSLPPVSEAAQQIASKMYPDFKEQAVRDLVPNFDQRGDGGRKTFFDEAASGNAPQQAAQKSASDKAQTSQGKNPVQEIVNQITGQTAQPQQSQNITSEEMYQRAFDIARANGSTMKQARQFAQQQAELYNAQRIQALSDQFLSSGVNPDKTINDSGVATLAALAQENPNQTNMLGNMYMTPQAQAKNAQDIAKMMTNSDLHLRNTMQAQQQAAALREQAAQAQFGRSLEMLNARQQAEIDQKTKLAEIISSIAGIPQRDAMMQVFGMGAHKGTDEDYARLEKWLNTYAKTNRDPLGGEWAAGTGPGDPNYDDRVSQYNQYTAKWSNQDDRENAARIVQFFIDKKYPKEVITEYAEANFDKLAPYIKRDLEEKLKEKEEKSKEKSEG